MNDPAQAASRQTGVHRRFALGAGGQVLSVGLLFAEQFLLVPIFLLFWGPERYGDWLVLLSAAGFVGLIEIGLQTYFGNVLQMIWARGEAKEAQRVLNCAIGIYAVLVIAAAVVVIALAFTAPWHEWLNLDSPHSQISIAIALLGLYVVAAIPFGLIVNVYRMHGEFVLNIAVANLLRATRVCLIAVLLWAGGGLVAIAGIELVVMLAACALVIVHQKHRYPQLRYGAAVPDMKMVRDMAAVAPFYALLPLGRHLATQGAVLLISVLGGAGLAVVAFTTTRTLCGSARMITGQISHVAGVEIARQYAQGDMEALSRMYRFANRLCGGLTGGLTGMIAVIGPPFLSIWTLGRVEFEPAVFWPLLAAAAASGAALAGSTVLQFINVPRALAAGHLGAGVTTIGLGAILVPWLGVPGAAAAVLVSEVMVLGAVVPWRAARIVGPRPAARIAATHGFTALAFAVSFILAQGAVAVTGQAGLAQLMAGGTLWAVAAGMATPWIILDAGQRHKLFARLRRRMLP